MSRPIVITLYGAACLLTACGLYGIDPPQRRESGQALLQVTAVPEEVKCVRVSAVGTGRSEERELAIGGAGDMAETLTGLPLGTVVFKGEAFTAPCSSVGKSTVAAWASEPVTTSIVMGRLTTVTLTMTRNGRAKIEVSFQDEAACTAVGASCRLPSECCSKHCTAGTCTAASDAGRD
jgi:hypothetical protein